MGCRFTKPDRPRSFVSHARRSRTICRLRKSARGLLQEHRLKNCAASDRFCCAVGGRSAHGPAGASRLWSPIRIGLRLASVGITTSHRVLKVRDVRIAVPFVAAGQASHGSPTAGRARGMDVPARESRFGVRFDTVASRAAASAFVHFALRGQSVLRLLWPSGIEIHSPVRCRPPRRRACIAGHTESRRAVLWESVFRSFRKFHTCHFRFARMPRGFRSSGIPHSRATSR